MRSRAFLLLAVAALAILDPDGLRAAPEAQLRLVPAGDFSFHVELTTTVPVAGIELGLRYDGAVLEFAGIRPGPDVLESVRQNGFLRSNPDPDVLCGDFAPSERGLVVVWVPFGETVPGQSPIVAHRPGVHRVLSIDFAPAPGIEAGACTPIAFTDCLGDTVAPVRPRVVDELGTAVPLTLEESVACDSPCRLLRFAAGEEASCPRLELELRRADGSALARREVAAAGLAGYDLARAFLRSFLDEPVEGVLAGVNGPALQLCPTTGEEPFTILVRPLLETTGGLSPGLEQEVLPGTTIGTCGLDVSGGLPTCADGDHDGHCDSADPCPGVANPGDDSPCPGDLEGFCRRVKFDPLCAFTCDELGFELREADGTTVIAGTSRTVVVPGNGTGLDIAVELCRAYEDDPPVGFRARRGSSGCLICRLGGTPFRIYLLHDPDGSPDGTTCEVIRPPDGLCEQEITVGAVTAACGLRIWAQPPDCADTGDTDVDGDGVCDSVDLCPAVFNPSQADLDGDCQGDACEALEGPFGLARCLELEPVALAVDEEATRGFRLEGCDRAACLTLRTPRGRPVVLELTRPDAAPCTRVEILLDGADTTVEGVTRFTSTVCRGTRQRLVVPEALGDYTLRVATAGRLSEPLDLGLRVRVVELALGSSSPGRAPLGGRVSVTVLGSGFEPAGAGPGTRFSLRPCAGGTPIEAERTTVVSRERAEVVFSIPPGAAPGCHELGAEEDGVTAVLGEALEVIEPGEFFGVEVQLVGPDVFRGGRPGRLTLRVTNAGNEEITAPLLKIVGPARSRLRLPRDLDFLCAAPGESPDLHCQELLVLARNPRGFAGTLAPGETARIPIILQNDDEACFLCDELFEVHLFSPLEGDAVRWDALEAPAGLEATWQGLTEALEAVLGTTWTEVHESLAAIATRLNHRGTDVASVRDLWRQAVREAAGCPASAIVGRVARQADGLPVARARVTASPEGGGPAAGMALTDSRGTFALEGLESGASYTLGVDGAPQTRNVTVPAGGVDDLLGVTLVVSDPTVDPGGATTSACDPADALLVPVFPAPGLFTKVLERPARFVRPLDPNEKRPPLGTSGYVGVGEELFYTIFFENKRSAGAPAQVVTITDVLPDALDPESVRLLDVGVGHRLIPLEVVGGDRENGYHRYTGGLLADAVRRGQDLTPERLADCANGGVDFEIDARTSFDARGRFVITWTFLTVDCQSGEYVSFTDATPDLRGFLPPNREPPLGEGFVTFSARVKPGLSDNSFFANLASIRFGDEREIITAPAENIFSLFLPAEPPTLPRPTDAGRRVPLGASLGWAPGKHTHTADLYFWKAADGETRPDTPAYTGIQKHAVVPPTPLEHSTDYRWQVVARNIRGVATEGPVWGFRTGNPAPHFRRGDVDGNRMLEITDAINDLEYQFLGTFAPLCLDAHDFDDNGLNEITDAIGNLEYQFLGRGEPAPPHPACGPDPTDDDLGCESYSSCE